MNTEKIKNLLLGETGCFYCRWAGNVHRIGSIRISCGITEKEHPLSHECFMWKKAKRSKIYERVYWEGRAEERRISHKKTMDLLDQISEKMREKDEN